MSIDIKARPSCGAEPEKVRELVAAFDRFFPLFSRFVQDALRDADTSPSRLRILRELDANGPSSMQTLAEGLCVAPRTVTSLVDGLEEEGLVVRGAHPTDRRTKVIEMTKEGHAGYARTERIYEEKLTELLLALPEDARRGLLEGHRLLAETLSKRQALGGGR